MENYFANPKKYNKTLFKYMGYGKDEVDYNQFKPEDHVIGYEILRWVLHKINHNPKEGKKMRVIISMKDEETEIFIQEWYDVIKPDGYINVVHHKEVCPVKKDEVGAAELKEEILTTSHRALYNACVDFIVKTT